MGGRCLCAGCSRLIVRRYEIVGGLLLAVGTPGVRKIGPLNPHNKFEVDDAVWDLETVAPERTEFTPSMLMKDSESLQWHEGDTRVCDGTRGTKVAALRVEVGTEYVQRDPRCNSHKVLR